MLLMSSFADGNKKSSTFFSATPVNLKHIALVTMVTLVKRAPKANTRLNGN
jgi:hypothetical protein